MVLDVSQGDQGVQFSWYVDEMEVHMTQMQPWEEQQLLDNHMNAQGRSTQVSLLSIKYI